MAKCNTAVPIRIISVLLAVAFTGLISIAYVASDDSEAITSGKATPADKQVVAADGVGSGISAEKDAEVLRSLPLPFSESGENGTEENGSEEPAENEGEAEPENVTDDSLAESNLEMILSSSTRNTSFDEFADVPMADVSLSDFTEPGDQYEHDHLDTKNGGFFRTFCEVAGFTYDDPLVFPGQPGKAHLHMMFGNTNTNAFSTYDSLLNSGGGSCNGGLLNRTAYWVPAMLDQDGNTLVPNRMMMYYKSNYAFDDGPTGSSDGLVTPVEPFPDGLGMITGNSGAKEPQTEPTGGPDKQGSPLSVSFSCGPEFAGENPQPLIPTCSGDALEMQIVFPSCWNGEDIYKDDQSHMVHPEGGYYNSECPESHPKKVSSIMYRIFWNPADFGGTQSNLHLSSDVREGELLPGGTTGHGDWWGAWNSEAMETWVKNCNNTRADCEGGLLDTGQNAVSLNNRVEGFYDAGTRLAADEMVKQLCPGNVFDPSNPVVSVSHCKH